MAKTISTRSTDVTNAFHQRSWSLVRQLMTSLFKVSCKFNCFVDVCSAVKTVDCYTYRLITFLVINSFHEFTFFYCSMYIQWYLSHRPSWCSTISLLDQKFRPDFAPGLIQCFCCWTDGTSWP